MLHTRHRPHLGTPLSQGCEKSWPTSLQLPLGPEPMLTWCTVYRKERDRAQDDGANDDGSNDWLRLQTRWTLFSGAEGAVPCGAFDLLSDVTRFSVSCRGPVVIFFISLSHISRHTLTIFLFFALSEFPTPSGEGPRPTPSRVSQRLVC